MITENMEFSLNLLKQIKQKNGNHFGYGDYDIVTKELFKDVIAKWLITKGFNRWDFHITIDNHCHGILLWNDKNDISPRRIRRGGHLNKLAVQNSYNTNVWLVRTHQVRTDVKFLSPFDSEFANFMQEIWEYISTE